MKHARSILQFLIVIAALLLAMWCQSWLLITIVFAVSVLLWRPAWHHQVLAFIKRLSPFQYKIGEWGLALVLALFVIWFIQSFLFSFYTVRSTSMLPTLQADELVLVNKLAYGKAIRKNDSRRYRRLNGYSKVNYADVIAFHFPEADTAFKAHSKEDYYFIKRQYETTKSYNPLLDSELINNKVSKRKPFIKRVVALPGDTLKISDGNIYVNNIYQELNEIAVSRYRVKPKVANELKAEILKVAFQNYRESGYQLVELQGETVRRKGWDEYLVKVTDPMNRPSPYVFPFAQSYFWNASHLGPIILPTQGKTIQLTLANIPLYKRIIESYEGNALAVKERQIFINGERSDQYTFRMNYYWVAGDNKKHSFDSRFWGFVPENHIIGKVIRFPFK